MVNVNFPDDHLFLDFKYNLTLKELGHGHCSFLINPVIANNAKIQ